MVVGDSISHGASGDWTWRYRLWQHFVADGIAGNINFVGPRDTVVEPTATTWTETHLYNDPNFDRDHDAIAGIKAAQVKTTIAGDVAAYTPDILLINLGTNDLGSKNAYGLDVDGQQAANEMSQLIDNARTKNKYIKIVLSKLTPNVLGEPYRSYWTDYNDRLAKMATSKGTPDSPIKLADPTPGYDPAVDTFDGVHPRPSGEYKIAAAFADALSSGFGVGTSYGQIPTAPAWPLATKSVWGTLLTSETGNSLQLDWTLAAGVDHYYVYMRQAGEESFILISPLVKGARYTTASLADGEYEFAVSSVRGWVTGPLSASFKLKIPYTRDRPASETPQMPDDTSTSRTRPPSDTPPMPGTTTTDGRTRPGSTTPNFP